LQLENSQQQGLFYLTSTPLKIPLLLTSHWLCLSHSTPKQTQTALSLFCFLFFQQDQPKPESTAESNFTVTKTQS